MEYNEEVKKLVITRLKSLPKNISFSVGGHGDFTRDELIDEVKNNTEVGHTAVEMQIHFIKKMSKLGDMLAAS